MKYSKSMGEKCMKDYGKLLEMLTDQSENKDCELEKISGKPKQGGGGFLSLPPEPFTGLATILGFIIANGLTINEQNAVGNFIELISQVILTINAQGSNLQAQNSNVNVSEQLDLIKKQIELLEKQL